MGTRIYGPVHDPIIWMCADIVSPEIRRISTAHGCCYRLIGKLTYFVMEVRHAEVCEFVMSVRWCLGSCTLLFAISIACNPTISCSCLASDGVSVGIEGFVRHDNTLWRVSWTGTNQRKSKNLPNALNLLATNRHKYYQAYSTHRLNSGSIDMYACM